MKKIYTSLIIMLTLILMLSVNVLAQESNEVTANAATTQDLSKVYKSNNNLRWSLIKNENGDPELYFENNKCSEKCEYRQEPEGEVIVLTLSEGWYKRLPDGSGVAPAQIELIQKDDSYYVPAETGLSYEPLMFEGRFRANEALVPDSVSKDNHTNGYWSRAEGNYQCDGRWNMNFHIKVNASAECELYYGNVKISEETYYTPSTSPYHPFDVRFILSRDWRMHYKDGTYEDGPTLSFYFYANKYNKHYFRFDDSRWNTTHIYGQEFYLNNHQPPAMNGYLCTRMDFWADTVYRVPSPDDPGFNSGTSDESNQASTIYRVYNRITGEHLFTPSSAEVRALTQTDWDNEGTGWKVPASEDPVYRLYNSVLNDHLYTKDKNEMNTLLNQPEWRADFNGERIFYSGGSIPVYRLYNEVTHQHLLTLDQNEYQTLTEHNWKQEGPVLSAQST